MREFETEKTLRYAYILEITAKTRNLRYYGGREALYPFYCKYIDKRYAENLKGFGSKNLKKYFPYSRKKLVFVKTIFGSEFDALKLKKELKALTKANKQALIESDENDLVGLNIYKNKLILKKYNNKEEQIVLDFGKFL